MNVTETQRWARDYSERLLSSFRSSASISHGVTKGDDRELQVLDTLEELLPRCLQLDRRPVIMGPDSQQSKSFDGVFLDRNNWPVLYSQHGPSVVMIESVRLLVEVKSELNKKEIGDVVRKIASVRKLERGAPPSAAFAYQSSNVALNYVDLLQHVASGSAVPEATCVLNECVISRIATYSQFPLFFDTGDDSLLFFLYQLLGHMVDSTTAETYRRYSKDFFESVQRFDPPKNLIGALKSEESAQAVRKSISGANGISLPDLIDKYS